MAFDFMAEGMMPPEQGLAEMAPGGGMGVPSTSAGGKGGASNWWAAVAAPIIAMLASKMSGGSMNFGDSLAALGTGFFEEKYRQHKQKRQAEFEQEQGAIESAKNTIKDLKEISPEVMQRYPKLTELSEKYKQALMDDGKISAKEAQEINSLYVQASQAMRKAKAETEGRVKEEVETESLARKMPPLPSMMPSMAGTGTSMPTGMPSQMEQAQGLMAKRALADVQRDTPQEVTLPDGQKVWVNSSEALRYMHEKATGDRAAVAAKLAAAREERMAKAAEARQRIMEAGMNKTLKAVAISMARADFREASTNWRLLLQEACPGKLLDQECGKLYAQENPAPRAEDFYSEGKGEGNKMAPAPPKAKSLEKDIIPGFGPQGLAPGTAPTSSSSPCPPGVTKRYVPGKGLQPC